MPYFQNIFNAIRGKAYGDVIFPSWDSVDIPNHPTSLRRSDTDFLKYNQLTLYVNRAIDKRAEKVGEIDFVLTKGEDTIEQHPLLDLLARPNPIHTGRQFWRLYQKYKDITGNAYIYVHKGERELFGDRNVELYLLRSDMVQPIIQGSDYVGFKYSKGNGEYITFSPDEIIYSFNPDPFDPMKGESLLRSGIRNMDTVNQLSDYHSSVLRNGGRVDGVLSFKSDLTATQMSELQEQYKEKYAEAKKAGRPLILGGDARYESLSLKPEELSFLESKKMTLDDICLMTGVPRAILSLASDETYSNADAAYAIFLRETIKPLLTDLTSILDWRFIPDDLELEYIDPTPEDIDRKIKAVKAASEVHAVTINEKREMLGLDPYESPEADEILVPFSEMPLTESAQPNREPVADPEEKSAKKFDHPLRDEATRRRYEKLIIRRYERREKQLQRAINGYFDEQQKRIVSHLETVKTYRRKGLADEVFDTSVELELAKGTVLPLIRQFVEESGKQALDLIGSSVEFVLAADIRSWMDERASTFAEQITETTYSKLKDEFEESLENGENRKQLIERIQNTYDGYSEGRATTIARTEVHNATQRGTFAGYTQANVPIKIWVAVGDASTRDAHLVADGQERPINSTFDVGGEKLMYPGDPSGSAAQTVNCRCSI